MDRLVDLWSYLSLKDTLGHVLQAELGLLRLKQLIHYVSIAHLLTVEFPEDRRELDSAFLLVGEVLLEEVTGQVDEFVADNAFPEALVPQVIVVA